MEALNNVKGIKEESVKYAQQHLANERTYLAWVRTAVSMVGVGFLTTSLHFTIKISSNHYINNVAVFLGIFACIVGLIAGVLATLQYSRKKKEIQDGIFIPSSRSIFFISALFSLLICIIFMYLSFLLFM
ncbi:YidH family protein [Lysinibacillus sp. NPDC097214]|uniref:YidH family protein n=1 Tax=Lysinibacillus sp. NPDC097214 TaxID=3390584 RepID=UPI003D08B1C2